MKNFPQVTKVKGISDIRYLPRKDKIRLGIKCKTQTGKDLLDKNKPPCSNVPIFTAKEYNDNQ